MTLCLLLFTMLFCGFAEVITGVDVDPILAQHRQSMQTILNMPNQRYSQQGQDECFIWYFDTLDRNMNIYRSGTAQCNITAKDAIQSLNVQGADTRYDFWKSTRDVCENFEWCDAKNDLLEFLNCYSNVVSVKRCSFIRFALVMSFFLSKSIYREPAVLP